MGVMGGVACGSKGGHPPSLPPSSDDGSPPDATSGGRDSGGPLVDAGTAAARDGIKVIDLSGMVQTNTPQYVARFFKMGDIPNYAQPIIDATIAATWQCNVKNRWPDGSVKFAIVAWLNPSQAAKATSAVTFQNTGSTDSGNAGATPTGGLSQVQMLDSAYDFDGQVQLTGSTSSPSVSARAILSGGAWRYWLQGPVLTAVILEDRATRGFDVKTDASSGNPLHPIFEAWFYPQTHNVEVGYTLENAWASSTGMNTARDQTFALTLTSGHAAPSSWLTVPTFTEYAFSRWRRSTWICNSNCQGGVPLGMLSNVQIDYDPTYLFTTGAYANIDPQATPAPADVAAEVAIYTSLPAAQKTIPGTSGASGGIVSYPGGGSINAGGEPTYGDFIGLYTSWDLDYLMTGDPRLFALLTDNADLAGRFSFHYREADGPTAGSGKYFDRPGVGTVDPQGHVVSINSRQVFTSEPNEWPANATSTGIGCGGTEAADAVAFASPFSGLNGWQLPGASHQPDFAFIPYTLTGKYYYLEELYFQAGYDASLRPGCVDSSLGYYREGFLGADVDDEVRGLAWTWRTLAYGAFAAADGDPEGPYFKDKLLNNVALMEGEHGLPLDVTDTADRQVVYDYGKNYDVFSQAANPVTNAGYQMSSPSPLGAFRYDAAAQSYAQSGCAEADVVAAKLAGGESQFMTAFMEIAFGMAQQLGVADTTELRTMLAKRTVHLALDPAVNRYLQGQYALPIVNTHGSWVADFATYQADYCTLPTSWGGQNISGWDYDSDQYRASMWISGASFMTQVSVDGYSGGAAFDALMALKRQYQASNIWIPKWSILPLAP
jgi:hypothetical protein